MSRLVWTEPAVADLDSIHSYISRDAEIYANAVILEILESVEQLSHFPESGRLVPELADGITRELIVGNYRIMYEVGRDEVRILTVLHGARKLPSDDRGRT